MQTPATVLLQSKYIFPPTVIVPREAIIGSRINTDCTSLWNGAENHSEMLWPLCHLCLYLQLCGCSSQEPVEFSIDRWRQAQWQIGRAGLSKCGAQFNPQVRGPIQQSTPGTPPPDTPGPSFNLKTIYSNEEKVQNKCPFNHKNYSYSVVPSIINTVIVLKNLGKMAPQ